ncbi:hypothetical protein [Microbacterium sp. AISO3]|uniref:hypothetical protein n=1 Tax=Microbacterium sp. AISO3 TaxID=2002831 RepID=UPI001130A20E|nr:hypothetical protein [Microbacterium sp. AISO3]
MNLLARGAGSTCATNAGSPSDERNHTPADNYSAVIKHRLIYATHNADHVDLNPAQRMAVQHLREQLLRLLRKRDTYLAFVESVESSPLGVGKRPTPAEQDIAYELTQGYFEQVYATLSALASVHGRIRLYPELKEAPISSNEKFLLWWEKVREGGWVTDAIEFLAEARDFRTVFMHPAMWSLYDWRTVGTADDVRIVLFGSESSSGNIPPGSVRSDGGGAWQFVAPEMDAMLWAFEKLCSASFGPIFTWYPAESDPSTCTWEPDGVGSTIGDGAARALRDALSAHDLDPHVKVLLAPNVLDELTDYIKAMNDIRTSVSSAPAASAIRTNIPAARPSLTLQRPFGLESSSAVKGD